MIQKLKQFNIAQAKMSLVISAYITLFAWVISLVMQTNDFGNEELVIHYTAVIAYAFILFKVTPNETED